MGEQKPRGRIIVEYWIGCGDCYEHVPLVELRRFGSPTANAIGEGWKYTKRHGWLCPKCQDKEAPDADCP